MHPFPSSDAMEAVTAARKALSKSESEEAGDVPLNSFRLTVPQFPHL